PCSWNANSCASSRVAARHRSAATSSAIARPSASPPHRAGRRAPLNYRKIFKRTHNVTHSSAPPSPAASPAIRKLALDRSAKFFARAEALIPAGVSSPVRAFRKVGGTPVFFREAQGAYATDEDGNR